jgi:hypothetical protein
LDPKFRDHKEKTIQAIRNLRWRTIEMTVRIFQLFAFSLAFGYGLVFLCVYLAVYRFGMKFPNGGKQNNTKTKQNKTTQHILVILINLSLIPPSSSQQPQK